MANLTVSAAVDSMMQAADQAGLRTSLGLGTAATQASTAFDAAGAATTAQSAAATDATSKDNAQTDKNAVRWATTAALPANTYSSGVLTASANAALITIDGVTPAVNDRCLVKNEATGANNGIYVVTAAGDSTHPYILTRAADASTSAQVLEGMTVTVAEGTANGKQAWVLGTAAPITLGSTALTFASANAGSLTAANNLSDLTSASQAQLNLLVAGRRLVSDAALAMSVTDVEVVMSTITATRTITLPQASTCAAGMRKVIRDGSGSCTPSINGGTAISIDVANFAGDTLNGGSTHWTIRNPYGYRVVESDGVSNWLLVGMSMDEQVFDAAGSFTWTKEPGAVGQLISELIGGGGGGGSGANYPSGTAATGGGAGSGGGYSVKLSLISEAAATEAVTVGAAGTGGASVSTASTVGITGVAGGNTIFGTTVAVRNVAVGGGAGGPGGSGTTGAAGLGGGGRSAVGGVGGTSSSTGGGGNPGQAYLSGNSGGGGGPGGGIPTTPSFQNGGHGGCGSTDRSDWGGAGSQGNVRGSSDGGVGGSPTNSANGKVIGAPGAGGGASSVLAAGGTGGTGAAPGGAGGGGGAAQGAGRATGAGGPGGIGRAVVRHGGF